MKKIVDIIVIGAGNRGNYAYSRYALKHPEQMRIVGVAEPDARRREIFVQQYNIPKENVFHSWEEILDRPQLSQAVIIATQDNMHTAPAIKAMQIGYDVLLEKPMANTLDECLEIVQQSQSTKGQLRICHVLRYTEFFSKVFEIIQSGRLGDIITIDHRENVSYYHMSHSYVRGNWRNKKLSSPMILAKCCHDLDLLYWLVGKKPKQISSFGSLSYYTKENAPEGAPDYCLDGCPAEKDCPFYAPRIYVDNIPVLRIIKNGGYRSLSTAVWLAENYPGAIQALSKVVPQFKKLINWDEWPANVITTDLTPKGKTEAIQKGPYGRCVFKCDNDVVDHQVTILEFENQATATLTMHGHSHKEGRTLRIDGTKGNLVGEFLHTGERLIFYDHLKGIEEVVLNKKMSLGGHGGGDEGLMRDFITTLSNGQSRDILTSAEASLQSHLMAFAAEKSRVTGKTIDMNSFP